MKHFMNGAAGLMAAGLVFLLTACGGGASSNKSSGMGSTDSAQSEVAIGVAAGATGSDDTGAQVALRSRTPLEWIVDQLAFERLAYAAGWSCGSPTWTGSGTSSQTFLPPNCTITYANGSMTTLAWTGGPWQLNFAGTPACVPPGNSGLVGSGCAAGGDVTWTTSASPITRTWTGPMGHTYAVTTDAGSGGIINAWTGASLASTGTLTTCTTACPGTNVSAGTRTISIGGGTGATNITGTRDGVLHWNHTVHTLTDLTVTGSGAHRVIQSGTVVVDHNLAHITLTTTFNGPLNHIAGCAFPISGSVTTAISGGINNGKTETVTFTGTCGVAVVTNPDGSQETLYLGLVL